MLKSVPSGREFESRAGQKNFFQIKYTRDVKSMIRVVESKQKDIHSNYKSTGFHHFMSWIDIADFQLMFQLKNEGAGFFSLIFRKVFQRLF
jgi:hypothetical protein